MTAPFPDPLLALRADGASVLVNPNDVAPLGPLSERRSVVSGDDKKKYKEWHDALIDFILLNPTASNAQIGAALNRGAQSIAAVRSSSIFRARYAARRDAHSRNVSDAVIHRTQNIALKSLERLEAHLDDDTMMKKTSPAALNEIAKTALETIGLLPTKGSQPHQPIQINQTFQSPGITIDDLNQARQRIDAREIEQLETGEAGARRALEFRDEREALHSQTESLREWGPLAPDSVNESEEEPMARPKVEGGEG